MSSSHLFLAEFPHGRLPPLKILNIDGVAYVTLMFVIVA